MTNEDKKWILEVIKRAMGEVFLDYDSDYDTRYKSYYVNISYALKKIDEELAKLETE